MGFEGDFQSRLAHQPTDNQVIAQRPLPRLGQAQLLERLAPRGPRASPHQVGMMGAHHPEDGVVESREAPAGNVPPRGVVPAIARHDRRLATGQPPDQGPQPARMRAGIAVDKRQDLAVFAGEPGGTHQVVHLLTACPGQPRLDQPHAVWARRAGLVNRPHRRVGQRLDHEAEFQVGVIERDQGAQVGVHLGIDPPAGDDQPDGGIRRQGFHPAQTAGQKPGVLPGKQEHQRPLQQGPRNRQTDR